MPLADLIKKRLRSSQTSLDSNPPDQPRRTSKTGAPPPRKRSVPVRELELLLRDDLNGLEEVDDEVFVSAGSNLSLNLQDVLENPSSGAIAYFVQYLEARDASNLLKFWIDVEGFKSFVNNNNNGNPKHHSPGEVLQASDFDTGPASNPQSPEPPSNSDQPDINQSGSTESFDSGFETEKTHSPNDSKSSHSKDALEIYQR